MLRSDIGGEYTSKIFETYLKQQRFLAEAVTTATYLRNRYSTRVVKGKTPYEVWHGKKLRVKHLRVFECNACAHIPRD